MQQTGEAALHDAVKDGVPGLIEDDEEDGVCTRRKHDPLLAHPESEDIFNGGGGAVSKHSRCSDNTAP